MRALPPHVQLFRTTAHTHSFRVLLIDSAVGRKAQVLRQRRLSLHVSCAHVAVKKNSCVRDLPANRSLPSQHVSVVDLASTLGASERSRTAGNAHRPGLCACPDQPICGGGVVQLRRFWVLLVSGLCPLPRLPTPAHPLTRARTSAAHIHRPVSVSRTHTHTHVCVCVCMCIYALSPPAAEPHPIQRCTKSHILRCFVGFRCAGDFAGTQAI